MVTRVKRWERIAGKTAARCGPHLQITTHCRACSRKFLQRYVPPPATANQRHHALQQGSPNPKPNQAPKHTTNSIAINVMNTWTTSLKYYQNTLNLNNIKPRSNLSCFSQHDGGRAVFFVTHGNRALHRHSRNSAASDGELHVDFGEHFGVYLGALGH
jgi:hypothetical protein